MHIKPSFLIMLWLCLLCAGTSMTGCRASECTQMSACCADVKGLEGLGEACGPLAEQTTNPDSCRSVKDTVRYMLEQRNQKVPPSCQ